MGCCDQLVNREEEEEEKAVCVCVSVYVEGRARAVRGESELEASWQPREVSSRNQKIQVEK